MNWMQSEKPQEIDVDAEADKIELEIDEDLAKDEDRSYLLPWLVPAIVLAAFVIIVLLFWLRR